MASGKRKKLNSEIEQIKRMQSIRDIINRTSSENTLLYTSSRENESLSDDTIDRMLSKMTGKESGQELHLIEGFAKGSPVAASRRLAANGSKSERHVNLYKLKRPQRKAVGGKSTKVKHGSKSKGGRRKRGR